MALFQVKWDLRGFYAKYNPKKSFIVGSKSHRIMATSVAHLVVPEARRNIRANKSVFEGTLFNSLLVRMIGPVIEVGTFGVEYGKNVEEGVPAGRPFRVTQKLVRWARLKVKAPRPVGFAMGTAVSMRMKGVKEKPFLMPAWEKKKGMVMQDYRRRWIAAFSRA